MTDETKERARARARELAAEYAADGRAVDWFDAFYREAAGEATAIPWADLRPNSYLQKWVEAHALKGGGRSALVVGCGLGDDASYLDDLGFKVTAFDISPAAIEWAKQLYGGRDIRFETADLFKPPAEWIRAFDFVLEVYTIQPLPLEMRPDVVTAVAAFVAPGGDLLVVTRGRGDDEEPEQMPWPLSRRDLSGFLHNGLVERNFDVMPSEDPDEPDRFVVEYRRPT